MQNLNEVSARYTELPKEFYTPTKWRVQDVKNKQGSVDATRDEAWHQRQTERLIKLCDDAYDTYEAMLADGVAREMARMVLPVNIYTEFYCSWDLKNLLHFVRLRDDSHAQAEIQEYGRAIKQILRELFPWSMEAYEKYKMVITEVPDVE